MLRNRHNIYRLLTSHSLDRPFYIKSSFYLAELSNYLVDVFNHLGVDGIAISYHSILQQFIALKRCELAGFDDAENYAVIYDPANDGKAEGDSDDTILILHHGW